MWNLFLREAKRPGNTKLRLNCQIHKLLHVNLKTLDHPITVATSQIEICADLPKRLYESSINKNFRVLELICFGGNYY